MFPSTEIVLTDTHCHLDFNQFDPDRAEVLERAKQAGVRRCIVIGTNLESSARAVRLAEHFPGVYATVGIHPNEAWGTELSAIQTLEQWVRHPQVVALGEMGLDYHYLPGKQGGQSDHPEDARRIAHQQQVFQAQLELAVRVGLPVVIHQRSAWEDVWNIMAAQPPTLRGVWHCFGENAARAQKVVERGHYLSFTGLITFKNAQLVREAIARVPRGSWMLETDAPYMAPVPFRGKRNEPAHVRVIAEYLAPWLGCTLDEIAVATEAATNSFFRFSS